MKKGEQCQMIGILVPCKRDQILFSRRCPMGKFLNGEGHDQNCTLQRLNKQHCIKVIGKNQRSHYVCSV